LGARKGTEEPPLLLDTKFYPPRSPRALVPRPRLRDSLVRGTASKLMLVSAPAGFGKSTLLAQWLTEWLAADPAPASTHRSAAWLSLDRDDDVPHSFWTYLVAALRRAVPGAAPTALALLRATPPAPVHTVVTSLLNDLGALDSDVVLVLDDYHVIDSREVHEEMGFLLDHLPPRLHLVFVSRADPALPLARMRARGELVEIRAAELRFTADEALGYLNDVMGLQLTPGDVATLEARTEGWIAALQLAALSMQGREDLAAFIVGFAGDDRYIVDYLVEEVLGRQPAEVRDFLLQTSVLRRLSGPLCDAVTGRSGGKSALEALERGNLFLVPLDDRRQWYRYHHLFADVLRAHLLADRGDEVPELHRRASEWFEHNAEPSEAIRHAVAGKDHDRAADLMELAFRHMLRDRQEAEVRSWVRLLPAEVVRRRPVLGMGFVAALASGSEFDTVEERLQDIEQSMLPSVDGDVGGDPDPSDIVVVDELGYLRLPGNIALYRAAMDLARGDVEGTVGHARQAILLAPSEDQLTRASAAALSGLASWSSGDLESASRGYAEGVDGLQRVGWLSDVLGCSVALADLRRAQGRLGDALHTCERALDLARPEPGSPPLRGTADMHVSISEVLRERDDLARAREHLARSQQLGEHNGLPQNPYRWRVAMARLQEADGDLDGALGLLDDAIRVYVGDYFPNVRPVPAVRARLHTVRGELAAAAAWAQEHQLSPDDDLTYLREYEHITLARLLLARHTSERAGPFLDEATHLLERLLAAADAGERTHSIIEILVLQARGHHARGDAAAALSPLHRAVTLAEPEGFVRLFADEGPPMATLLRGLAKQGTAAGYVRRLTAASLRGTAPQPPVRQALVEPLSERELDVLRLLGSDLDGPDIARELNVSLNTMRTHTKNIYAKLGVTSRRAAVSQAHELDLLPGPRHR
jgi:LuxR family transcriptional regulator, maltose regulon positive regulatory protein